MAKIQLEDRRPFSVDTRARECTGTGDAAARGNLSRFRDAGRDPLTVDVRSFAASTKQTLLLLSNGSLQRLQDTSFQIATSACHWKR